MIETERAILESRFEAEVSQGAGALPDDLQAQLAEAKALVEEKREKITQLRELVEQWAKEEALATARAQELEDGLQRAHQAQAAAQAAALAAAQAAAKVTGESTAQAGETNGRAAAVTNGVATKANATPGPADGDDAGEVAVSEHDDWECDVVTRTCSEPTRDE